MQRPLQRFNQLWIGGFVCRVNSKYRSISLSSVRAANVAASRLLLNASVRSAVIVLFLPDWMLRDPKNDVASKTNNGPTIPNNINGRLRSHFVATFQVIQNLLNIRVAVVGI